MGLFDIFKRRNKKNKHKEPAAVEQSSADHNEIEQPAQSTVTTSSQTDSNITGTGSAIHDHDSSSADSSESTSANDSDENKRSEAPSTSNIESVSNSSNEPAKRSASTNSTDSAHPVPRSTEPDVQVENSTADSETEQAASGQNREVDESSSSNDRDYDEVIDHNDDSEDTDEVVEQNESTKYEHGLAKSRSSFGKKLNQLFANFRSVDEDFFEDLEDTLIESDVGFDMAVNLTDQLREEVKLKNVKSKSEVQNVVVQKLIELYDQSGNGEQSTINFAKEGPTVILFVGVNGVGKTTTIGKMAKLYHDQGKKVLLAAADTFRAGAIQQLDVWAQRDEVDIVKKPEKSDPASVVYDAIQKAKKEQYDVLFVDTAGRLQNKVNLMNELSKMKKILTREIPTAPNEVMLVLDATTGQNALNQAKLFKQVTDVTGITLTKLDGTAKGGIVLAIRNELHIPVKYVGLGEQVGDLQPFNANDFVYGLFKGLLK